MVGSSIIVFLVGVVLSMTPVIEAKGAIPFVMSSSIWGEFALSPLFALISAIVGGILASFLAVLIFLPFRKILERFKIFRAIFSHCDKGVNSWLSAQSDKIKRRKASKGQKKTNKKIKKPSHKKIEIENEKIEFITSLPTKNKQKKAKNFDKTSWGKFAIVFIFCALPIPFSGVWSAGALCSVLKLRFWYSVLALILANTFSAIFIGIFCTVLSEFVDLILCALCIILIMLMLYNLIKFLLTKIENKRLNRTV